jgi:hypothetical protein
MSGQAPITAGLTYTGSAYFKPLSVVRNVGVNIRWFNAALVYLDSTVGTQVPEVLSTWTRASATGVAPAGAVWADLEFDIVGLAEDHLVDASMLEKGYLRPYFDASLAPASNYMWSGTPHASVSNYYPRRDIKDYRLRTVLPDYVPAGITFQTYYGQTAPASSV